MTVLSHVAELPPSGADMIGTIRKLEDVVLKSPQTAFVTEHVFHAGMYARTVRIPANTLFTSVLIKRSTLIITHGILYVMAGNQWMRLDGYQVVTAAAGRKQVYATGSDIEMTMIFPTDATTVEQAESEFTDETENLLSRKQENDIVSPCLE